ncbi:MAG: hypothetical protein HY747_02860 [Elusimicrobia bacterium]|nr:hypothetical protein [Elusimicrobiota bacterium]
MELSWDLQNPHGRPYFLWEESLTLEQLKGILCEESPRRYYYMARILHEADYNDVWKFIRPQDIAVHWRDIEPYLGNRREYWNFLLAEWHHADLLA